MNNRLECIASYINNGIGMVDVGTDHGYLPVELCLRGYPGNIYASDINEDPLNKAKNTAATAGVFDKINFLLCDGLDLCPQESIDTIVVAGMGGDTICSILDKAEWCMDEKYTLLLQPMTKAEVLRYWLVYNGFEITNEELVEDNESIYQVIVSKFGGETKLNDAELFCGKAELNRNKALFTRYKESLYKRFFKAVSNIEKTENEDLKGRAALLKDILSQFERM